MKVKLVIIFPDQKLKSIKLHFQQLKNIAPCIYAKQTIKPRGKVVVKKTVLHHDSSVLWTFLLCLNVTSAHYHIRGYLSLSSYCWSAVCDNKFKVRSVCTCACVYKLANRQVKLKLMIKLCL